MKPFKIIYFYKDPKGRVWEVWKDSIPKKRGELEWWSALHREPPIADVEFRGSSKKSVLQSIKTLSQFK